MKTQMCKQKIVTKGMSMGALGSAWVGWKKANRDAGLRSESWRKKALSWAIAAASRMMSLFLPLPLMIHSSHSKKTDF